MNTANEVRRAAEWLRGANARLCACVGLEEKTRELNAVEKCIHEAAPMHSRSAKANAELDKAIMVAAVAKRQIEEGIEHRAKQAHLS